MSESESPGRWWYLDLAAEFPSLEIYTGHGWGPAQETGLIELGERVMTEEALWLFTWIYSRQRDRNWAAAAGMFRMVVERIRRDRGLADGEPVDMADIPAGWLPDGEAWDRSAREEDS